MNQFNQDSILLSRLQNDDKQAFTQLYHLYSERLYINLVRLVKSEQLAEEVVQDVFTIIWEKRKDINIHQSFRSYIYKIGENKVMDFFRKARRDKELFEQIKRVATEQYTHIEEELLSGENSEFLKKAIESLPPQRKQIFQLCKLEGRSYNEVGRLLGISTSTINDHIVKATKSIRDFFYSHRQYSSSVIMLMILNGL
ncbi:MAG: RNA polymerase sigma factor [Flavisolibacter sp.]